MKQNIIFFHKKLYIVSKKVPTFSIWDRAIYPRPVTNQSAQNHKSQSACFNALTKYLGKRPNFWLTRV